MNIILHEVVGNILVFIHQMATIILLFKLFLILIFMPHTQCTQKDLAILTAEANGSPLILATDPDVDRLALAERNPITKEWKIFSGNEIGTLLSWWAFKNYKEKHPNFDG